MSKRVTITGPSLRDRKAAAYDDGTQVVYDMGIFWMEGNPDDYEEFEGEDGAVYRIVREVPDDE